jgi:shikimate dehydrogenase
MSETIPRACVIGSPVAHSRSPLLHGYWLRNLALPGGYDRQEVSSADFPRFLRELRQHGYVGANVTVPHKEAAFRIVDRRDQAAQAIGAVNTVWFEDGQLVGGNTDAYGFIANLEALLPEWSESVHQAIVLGAGGAARAIVHGLVARGVGVALINRTLPRAVELAAPYGKSVQAHGFTDLPSLLGDADLLVNATSLGMVGKMRLALDITGLKGGAIVYDIVYVPLVTPLLTAAAAQGHRTVDGLGMLLHQAVPGFARWFGHTPTVTPELRALIEADIRATTGAA